MSKRLLTYVFYLLKSQCLSLTVLIMYVDVMFYTHIYISKIKLQTTSGDKFELEKYIITEH